MLSKEVLDIIKRLQLTRLNLMRKQPFYAVLLLHMQFSLDPMCETAYTDGEHICFGPDFINSLSDSELEFVLMHEVLHAALNHANRLNNSYDYDDYNTACDIVVNSNILSSCKWDKTFITLKNFGESMHLTPEGDEGVLHTVEEVYRMIRRVKFKNNPKNSKGEGNWEDNEGAEGKNKDDEGGKGEKVGEDGGSDSKRNEKEKSESTEDENEDNGEGENEDEGEFNGEGEKGGRGHSKGGVSSTGKGEGEVKSKGEGKGKDERNGKDEVKGEGEEKENGTSKSSDSGRKDGGFDDHSYWGSAGKGDGNDPNAEREMEQVWLHRMVEATGITEQIVNRKDSSSLCGSVPLGAQRIINELTKPQTDWRTVLDNFIQEEITDYSFNPPDRRFQDSPFLLPDYNEKDESVKDILFMIDTSGSMSDKMITQAYSEIYGAIEQFNGKLQGWLGFFDAEVVKPKPFTDEEEFRIIRPEGGGGTNFHCIFDYVREHNDEIEPVSIVILTDGYAPFPDEEDTMDIPVLWIINNEDVTPPWGKTTRIEIEDGEY
ncbi:MAG: VWA-like domain-containing protein [Clostridiales bacterium]|nr:VWA-like domain-containing protein [Clostridiales bacterium]